ncbi:hypothetical protein AB0L74_10185 [Streptomyces sp. NPDC052020]|uniref:hypothetical protein n=1 Tax=Streptomyces sp. NPDC052020 TaxID=3155677 RepID=UPI0034144C52
MPVILEKPRTHAGAIPASLIGLSVMARPFYHVPESRSSLRAVRSPFTFEARVIETFGDAMVVVEFTWDTASAPWKKRAIFYPRELHQTAGWFPVCMCPACAGDGIHEHNGA